jgi:hypothetical protein
MKEKPDYLKFLPDLAPLNLALSPGRKDKGGRAALSHFGIQVDSRETVLSHLARVKAAGLYVREEMNVNCCYANQDKFWVQDPDGMEWEFYYLNFDLDQPAGEGKREVAIPLPSATPCCSPVPAS